MNMKACEIDTITKNVFGKHSMWSPICLFATLLVYYCQQYSRIRHCHVASNTRWSRRYLQRWRRPELHQCDEGYKADNIGDASTFHTVQSDANFQRNQRETERLTRINHFLSVYSHHMKCKYRKLLQPGIYFDCPSRLGHESGQLSQ
jgi:hypothetical protein